MSFPLQICDKIDFPIVISVFGNLLLTISSLFLGQHSLLGLHKSFSFTQGMFTLFGCGYSLIFISTFDRIYRQTIAKGYSDNIETYLVVSGITLVKMILLIRFIISALLLLATLISIIKMLSDVVSLSF